MSQDCEHCWHKGEFGEYKDDVDDAIHTTHRIQAICCNCGKPQVRQKVWKGLGGNKEEVYEEEVSP